MMMLMIIIIIIYSINESSELFVAPAGNLTMCPGPKLQFRGNLNILSTTPKPTTLHFPKTCLRFCQIGFLKPMNHNGSWANMSIAYPIYK